MKTLSLSIYCLLVLNIFVHAQSIPPFYPPTNTELQTEGTIPYLILYDFGQMSFELQRDELLVRYDYYKRIKLGNSNTLDEDGLQILYGKNNQKETLTGLKGIIYSVGETGELKQLELEKLNISQRNLNSYQKAINIDIRNLNSGSIIVYTYTIYSNDFFELKGWDFQQEAPILKSEYHTYIPKDYEYLSTFQGNIDELQKEETPYVGEIVSLRGDQLNLPVHWLRSRLGYEVTHQLDLSGKHTQFILENIPPLIQEPYMGSINDYLIQFRQQLIQVNVSMTGAYYMIGSWRDINSRLLKHIHFGQRLEISGAEKERVKDRVNKIASKEQGGLAKAKAIYKYLRTQISWNGEYSIFSGSLRQVMERRIGNGAEINFLLVSFLRAANLKAYPVLISTKEHGKINPTYPMVGQFNHVITALKLKGKYILLDALSDVVAFGMLPRNDLNGYGFLVDGAHSDVIELAPVYSLMRNIYGRFELDYSSQMLRGDMYVTHRAYSAALERARLRYQKMSTETYLKTILTNALEADISSLQISNKEDIEEPLTMEYNVEVPDHIQQIGNLTAVSPFSSGFFEINPFQSPQRQFPVDFSCPIQESQTFVLEISPNYEIVQLPENTILALPNEGGTFIYNVVGVEGVIRISSTLQLNQTVFAPEEYPNMRDFFNFIVQKLDEDIILRRIQTQE